MNGIPQKTKKIMFAALVTLATVILLSVGSTYAYFSAYITSTENAISMGAAVFEITMRDDISLVKTQLIPSEEKYVDIASSRIDKTTGEFIVPYEQDGKLITKDTVCIDDNLNEICSIYSFTIENPMTDIDLPLYITLVPTLNTFDNLYFKVLEVVENETGEKEVIEVVPATKLTNNRDYDVDEFGNKSYIEEVDKMPIPLDGINKTLPKSEDKDNPSSVTYSMVLWIMETGENQTTQDSKQFFGGLINVSVSGADGQGINGVFSVVGVE